MVPESGTSKAPKGDNEEAKILETEEKSSGPLYLELEKENLQIVQESSSHSYHSRSIIYPDEPISEPHDQQPTGQDRNISHPGPGDEKVPDMKDPFQL